MRVTEIASRIENHYTDLGEAFYAMDEDWADAQWEACVPRAAAAGKALRLAMGPNQRHEHAYRMIRHEHPGHHYEGGDTARTVAGIAYRVAEYWDADQHTTNAHWAENRQAAEHAWLLLNVGSIYRPYVTSHAINNESEVSA